MSGPFLVLAVALRQSGVPLTARVQHCKPAPHAAGSIAGRHRCSRQARGDTPGFGDRVRSDGEHRRGEPGVAIALPEWCPTVGLSGSAFSLLRASVSLSVEWDNGR